MFKKITKKITIIASSIPSSLQPLSARSNCNNKDYQDYFHDITTENKQDCGDSDSERDSSDDGSDDEMDVVPVRNGRDGAKVKPSNPSITESNISSLLSSSSLSTIFQTNNVINHNDILSPSKRKRENDTENKADKENLQPNVANTTMNNKDKYNITKKAKDVRFDTKRQQAEKLAQSGSLKHPLHGLHSNIQFEDVEGDKAEVDVEVNSSTDDEEFLISVFSKVRHNHIDTISEYLKKKQITCFMRDKTHGNTILHICAQNNHKKMMMMIINSGNTSETKTVLNFLNKKGMTPLDYAYHYKFYGLASQLESLGALPGSRVLVGDNSYRK